MRSEPKHSADNAKPIPRFAGSTDVGCVREHNEDSFITAPPLFAVADGMGGHAAGEVASELAILALQDARLTTTDPHALEQAVRSANAAVIRGVQEGVGREGMGTTLTAALVEGQRLVIAQVGDSRAYLLHGDNLQQLTRDHSLMAEYIEAGRLTPEEARYHPQRSVITRALGSLPSTEPDIYELNASPGDRLLICSDGLTAMLRDDDIASCLTMEPDPERCVQLLIDEARIRGGYDNITVIVVDIDGPARRQSARRKGGRGKATAALVACLLVGAVAAAGIGFNAWVSNAAYLADNDGTVAIYRGVRGEIAGHSFSTLEATSAVRTDDLNAGLATRMKSDGVAADNLESAERLLESYAAELGMESPGIAHSGEEPAASADASPQGETATPSASAGAGAGAGADAADADDPQATS